MGFWLRQSLSFLLFIVGVVIGIFMIHTLDYIHNIFVQLDFIIANFALMSIIFMICFELRKR